MHFYVQPKIGYLPVWAICRENTQLWTETRLCPPQRLHSLKFNSRCISTSCVWQRRQKKSSLSSGDTLPVCPPCPSVDLPLMTLLSAWINAHTNTAAARDWCLGSILCQRIGWKGCQSCFLPGNQDHLLLRLSVTAFLLFTSIIN